jgi:hypothetical protein
MIQTGLVCLGRIVIGDLIDGSLEYKKINKANPRY